MKFRATIEQADGSTREVEFTSVYDARASLESVIEKDHLRDGETIRSVWRVA